MPMIIKSNLAVEFGVSNGSRGTLVDVILDPREPPIPAFESGQTEPTLHKLRYQPLALLIQVESCTLEEPIDPTLSNDPMVIPVLPSKHIFELLLNPKQKNKQKQKKLRIQRTQFEVFPGYGVTAHGA